MHHRYQIVLPLQCCIERLRSRLQRKASAYAIRSTINGLLLDAGWRRRGRRMLEHHRLRETQREGSWRQLLDRRGNVARRGILRMFYLRQRNMNSRPSRMDNNIQQFTSRSMTNSPGLTGFRGGARTPEASIDFSTSSSTCPTTALHTHIHSQC